MDRMLIAGLSLLGVLAAPAWAQESDSPPKADVKQLIKQLGDPSYKARKSAEQALRARGDEARDALEQAAKNSDDPEVRWRAQRILRAGEGDAGGEALRLRQLGDVPDRGAAPSRRGLENRFDDLFGRLERDFGIDVPRQRFFDEGFFQDLQQQMEEMRQRMRGGIDADGFDQSQSMQLQVGPDGVSVKVKERNDKGDVEEKTYEAENMESFREKYPDVARRYFGGNGGLRWNFAFPHAFAPRALTPRAIDRLPAPRGRLLPRGTPPAPPAVTDDGPKLGVMVGDLAPDVREFLGLEDGQGLVVQEVLDASLAESLKVHTGDVVLEVNGRKVFGVEDVAAALSQEGDEITVEVNRRGETLKLSGKRPAAEAEKKTEAGKLKKRAGEDKPQIR